MLIRIGCGVCSIIQCKYLYKHLQTSRKLLTHFQKEINTSINNAHVNYFEKSYYADKINASHADSRNTFLNNLTSISIMHMWTILKKFNLQIKQMQHIQLAKHINMFSNTLAGLLAMHMWIKFNLQVKQVQHMQLADTYFQTNMTGSLTNASHADEQGWILSFTSIHIFKPRVVRVCFWLRVPLY